MAATRTGKRSAASTTVAKALGRLGRAFYGSAPVRAARERVRRGLVRLGRAVADGAWAANVWFYRRFGRSITLSLAGLGFLSLALVPDYRGLYRGVDWNSDLDCLAMNIYHEARNEPEAGKLAVGHVVMNRMFDRRFPGTVCEVVMQGGPEPHNYCQFSWWCDGKDDEPLNQQAWIESQYLASRIFAGTVKDPTGGALWYHADYVNPSWSKAMAKGPQIGRHKFYQRR